MFCNSGDYYIADYYYDIVREWYDVSEKTKFPRGLNPEKCPHDDWLTEDSIKLVELLSESVRRNDYKFTGRGVSLADANHESPKDVLNLLSNPDTMEFVILENVEFQRKSLSEEITQSAASANIAITFEQFEEIKEVGQRKLNQLNEGKLDWKKLRKELHDYVKAFNPKVDDRKFSRVIDILNMFFKRENENDLCQQAIKMIKGLSKFIDSLDA